MLGTLGWRVAWSQVFAMGVMVAVTGLAYRRIEVAARLMVVLWAGMLATVAWVIVAGLTHFEPTRAFGVPAGAWTLDQTFLMGLGAAVAIAMYDFLGYYQICYMGDEVADAPRTIPRAILISVVAVATIYLIMNVSILGVIPWHEVVASEHIATDLMGRLYGSSAATFVTLMIVWTALASVFSALLGYSRVPYAAARSGHFFRGLARTHPTGDFPHRSLLLIGSPGHARLPGEPGDGDRGLADGAHPDPVHRPDRDGLLPEDPPRAPRADAVPDVALPRARARRAGRLALRLRHLETVDPGLRGPLPAHRPGRLRGLGPAQARRVLTETGGPMGDVDAWRVGDVRLG